MSLLQQYLYVIGSFQGMLLAFLLMFGSGISNASRILGVWCLLLALSFLAYFITLDREVNAFTGLLGWNFFIPASYGALLYLYCRHALVDQQFKVTDLLHFLPIVICCVLNLDFLLASPEVKLQILLTRQPKPLTFQLAEWILFGQAFVYVAFSVALIRKYQSQAGNTLSDFNPDIFSWLWKLLLLDLVIWTLKAADVIFGHQYPLFILGDVLIIVLIYSIAMAQWRNPRLFRLEHFSEVSPNLASEISEKSDTHLSVSEADMAENSNRERDKLSEMQNAGALDAETRGKLLKVVQQHMLGQQAFLDDQLTLTRLANAIGVSTHHLSEVLNQHDGKNFYQFVNEYRINYFCEKLKSDPSTKILDLALLSGFSSKSTFNAVFKQFTGQTPSQFREQLIAITQ